MQAAMIAAPKGVRLAGAAYTLATVLDCFINGLTQT